MSDQDGHDALQRVKQKVEIRNDTYAEKPSTKIWKEIACESNPYICKKALCHGYDLFDIAQKKSFSDSLFLLLLGELPSPEQSELLEKVMILFMNPGPRAYPVRAAMKVGSGRTAVEAILPAAIAVAGGSHLGSAEVGGAVKFFRASLDKTPQEVYEQCLEKIEAHDGRSDLHILPGFGARFGSIDTLVQNKADILCSLSGAGRACAWSREFGALLEKHNLGLLETGLFAAVVFDLGFEYRLANCLFQLVSAPGMLAHGVEVSRQPVTDMPFVSEENYVIER
ncbi:MAG: citrate synthase [Gammaproteobacteria bacterium]|nr:citrate synthase [Gammaproteobacteria bacterium]